MVVFSIFQTVKWIPIFLLLLVASCSMNAEQEQSLNQATSLYLDAHNNGYVMSYVAMIYPDAVKYYKSKGDNYFKSKFELISEENKSSILQDGILKEIRSKDENIQVHYNFIEVDNLTSSRKNRSIIAISEDNGKSWFFLDKEDYLNNDIVDKENRLIDFK